MYSYAPMPRKLLYISRRPADEEEKEIMMRRRLGAMARADYIDPDNFLIIPKNAGVNFVSNPNARNTLRRLMENEGEMYMRSESLARVLGFIITPEAGFAKVQLLESDDPILVPGSIVFIYMYG